MDSVVIGNDRLYARVIPFGASLVDLRLDGGPPLILGFADLESYRQSGLYSGAIIGRHANRLSGAHAVIAGRTVALAANDGDNHLHGGPNGFGRRDWNLVEEAADRVTLLLVSPDGDENYPGRVVVEAAYQVAAPATLRLTLSATSDRETIINLAHHPYFNLMGAGDILAHTLTIAAERYLPTSDQLIPSGEIADVAGTRFDFRTPHRLAEVLRQETEVFNHNYCLADAPRAAPHFAARLTAPNGLTLEVWTTQTGLHFYEGYKIADAPEGIAGRHYDARSGLCLEAQNWPDSPNHSEFPSAVLRPGEGYRQVTEYRFSGAM